MQPNLKSENLLELTQRHGIEMKYFPKIVSILYTEQYYVNKGTQQCSENY